MGHEHQYQMKREMMVANSHMLKAKEEIRKKEIEQEAKIVALMKVKFAQDETNKRQEEAIRQRNKEKHLSLIEKQRADKRIITDQEALHEAQMQKELDERETFRKRV